MPTLRLPPDLDGMAPEEREVLERIAKRQRTTVERLTSGGIQAAESHWPALLEASRIQNAQSFSRLGALPTLTKQALHVGISMSNACDY